MKQTFLKFICSAVFALSALLPVSAQEAFYIYRNDGQFNAFFNDEVDSIIYSKIALDSTLCDDYVVQEVYTADSLYRIPLAAIDSVGFVTPETVYKSGVTDIAENLWQYVITATDSTLLLQSSTPSKLIPQKGDKLVYTEMTETFPAGFAGEVSSVTTNADGIFVSCVAVDLEEIFDTYYGVTTTNNPQTRSVYNSGRQIIAPGTFSLPTKWLEQLSASCDLKDDYALDASFSFGMDVTPKFEVSAMVIIDRIHGTYYTISCIGDYHLSQNISFSGSLSYSRDFKIDIPPVPIPLCPFVKFYFEPGLFVQSEVQGGLNQTWSQHYRSVFLYEYSSKGEEVLRPVNKMFMVGNSYSGEAMITGSVAAGAYAELGFAISDKKFTNVHLRAEGGYELESNAVVYKKEVNTALASTAIYDRLKDSRISVNKFYGASAEAEFMDKYTLSFELPLGKKENLLNVAHVPSFSGMQAVGNEQDETSAMVSATATGACFLPLRVGLLINDKNGNDTGRMYHGEKHYINNTSYSHQFSGLEPGETYSAHPIVHAYGIEMLASPSASFTLDKLDKLDKIEEDKPTPGEIIDFGLSVKWASHNVGASSPEEFGGYYAWGETEEKSDYSLETYKHAVDYDGDGYGDEYIYIGSNISGTQYDVARVKWGGSWRMPTQDEIRELVENCSWKWTTYNGVKGQLVTGPNGNSIFLPAAGFRYDAGVEGDCGFYWSAAPREDYSGCAWNLYFDGNRYDWYYWGGRTFGCTVRPVSD